MPQIVRLFVDQPLGPGQPVALTADQSRYLFTVMRLAPGDEVRVFNGRSGEWSATVAEAGKRTGRLTATAPTAPQRTPPDLWLLFAPLKKARTDFIVEKATELGAARILPVQTRLTNADRIARDRLQAHAVEAAEQCGGTFVPEVAGLQPLDRLLDSWPASRRLWWCDEHLAGTAPVPDPPASDRSAPGAILTGPEGGFAEAERSRLRALPFVRPVALGPRILRADTAAVAALALWQTRLGDWR
jgi:16S rRNA (uracil1498-N3)-methyltransferase